MGQTCQDHESTSTGQERRAALCASRMVLMRGTPPAVMKAGVILSPFASLRVNSAKDRRSVW